MSTRLNVLRAIDSKTEAFSCQEVIDSLQEPKAENSLKVHWLAIDGEVPMVSRNIIPQTEVKTKFEELASTFPQNLDSVLKLSSEMKMYYEEITMSFKMGDSAMVDVAYQSLRNDNGIQHLVPYLAYFLSCEVSQNLRNVRMLMNLMKMMRALVDNPHLEVEPYLHQFLPSLVTCVLGKTLCKNETENHWELRDYAASLLALICKKYCSHYPSLPSQITKVLVDGFLDQKKPLTTHYGAILAITHLDSHAIEMLIIPHLSKYWESLQEEMKSPSVFKKQEAEKVEGALLRAAQVYLMNERATLPSSEFKITCEKLKKIFGSRLMENLSLV